MGALSATVLRGRRRWGSAASAHSPATIEGRSAVARYLPAKSAFAASSVTSLRAAGASPTVAEDMAPSSASVASDGWALLLPPLPMPPCAPRLNVTSQRPPPHTRRAQAQNNSRGAWFTGARYFWCAAGGTMEAGASVRGASLTAAHSCSTCAAARRKLGGGSVGGTGAMPSLLLSAGNSDSGGVAASE